MDGPLAGILVVDLTRILAGPWCTRILADMGARVVKVEASIRSPGYSPGPASAAIPLTIDRITQPPGVGDSTRRLGVKVAAPADPTTATSYFAQTATGKESISLDLKCAWDRDVLHALLARADVLVENYRPGVMARLGLGWEALHERHPSLIVAAISGYGQSGPDSALGAVDTIAQAASGLMSVTGHPGLPPTRMGASISDVLAGVYGMNRPSPPERARQPRRPALP